MISYGTHTPYQSASTRCLTPLIWSHRFVRLKEYDQQRFPAMAEDVFQCPKEHTQVRNVSCKEVMLRSLQAMSYHKNQQSALPRSFPIGQPCRCGSTLARLKFFALRLAIDFPKRPSSSDAMSMSAVSWPQTSVILAISTPWLGCGGLATGHHSFNKVRHRKT